MTQEQLNQLTQLRYDMLHHEMYGTRYLLKPDGSIVLRYPDGAEGPLPEYTGEDDDEL